MSGEGPSARGATAALTIGLPIPARAVSPNGRGHWRTRARAVAEHRTWGQLAAVEALHAQGGLIPRFPPGVVVTVVATVYRAPQNRVQDDDNFKASCKPYLDGFTSAGIWADDRQARWGAVSWATARESPWGGKAGVLLTLTAEEV